MMIHQTTRYSDIALYAISAILCLIGTYLVLHLGRLDWTLPFMYQGDQLFELTLIKSIVDTGWYEYNPYLGAPFGLQMGDQPQGGDNGSFIILKLMSLFTQNPFLLINLFFLLSFFITALCSTWALRRYGISRGAACVFGLLFSFLPYHFMRSENHLFLSCYWVVPLLFVLLKNILEGRHFRKSANSRRTIAWNWVAQSLVLVFWIGSGGIYYAVFSCFVLVVVTFFLFVNRYEKALVYEVIAFIVLVGAVVVLNLLPSLIYQLQNSKNGAVANRSFTETEFYGLKIARLFLPAPGHRIHFLSNLRGGFSEYLSGEGGSEALGVLGSIGLLVLLGSLFWVRNRRGADSSPNSIDLTALAASLVLAILLFATIGGFSSLFSYLVSPQIRAYNRISVFVAFPSLAVMAVLVDRLRAKILDMQPFWSSRMAVKRTASFALLAIVLGFGLFDQTNSGYGFDQRPWIAHLRSDQEFVHKIEAAVPQGSRIFQLPYVPFPENPPVHKMPDYDHLKMYVNSSQLSWSYGAMKGRAGDAWQKAASNLPTEEFLQALVSQEFQGITVTLAGFEDGGRNILTQLGRVLGTPTITSPDGEKVFFALAPYRDWLVKDGRLVSVQTSIVKKLEQITDKRVFAGESITSLQGSYFASGWLGQEGPARWSSRSDAEIVFQFGDDVEAQALRQIVLFITETRGTQRIDLQLNRDKLGTYAASGPSTIVVEIPQGVMKRGSLNVLKFHFPDAKRVDGNNEDRLALALQEIQIK